MKGLILAGGKGDRLKPLTHSTPKQLLPVANRPILFYALDKLAGAGISDIGIVVSPHTGHLIRDVVGDGSQWNSRVSYVVQTVPLGLAHAVKTARDFLGTATFLMFLGDNLVKDSLAGFVNDFEGSSADAMVLLKEVPDPRRLGVAELDKNGQVIGVEEKPKQPKSNYALTGIYIFSAAIHRAIDAIKPSLRGELEITDAIQNLLQNGAVVRSRILRDWWLDTGGREDLLQANDIALDELLSENIAEHYTMLNRFSGKIALGKGAVIERSELRGPVSIADDCVIRNSVVGPFVSLGKGTVVENTTVEHSLVMEGSHLAGLGLVANAVLGKRVKLQGHNHRSGSLHPFLGDDCSIEL